MISNLTRRALSGTSNKTNLIAKSSLATRSFSNQGYDVLDRSQINEPGSKGKMVLLYSGGLDTSTVLKWLTEDGYDVIALICNIGQYGEDFDAAVSKAKLIGAHKVYCEDIRADFLTEYVYPALQCNAMYEGRYLLGTSLARYPIAKSAIDIALENDAVAVSHGATGKGNDQVRFELSMMALAPHLEMISPWRDPRFFNRFAGRQDLMAYAADRGIPVTQTKKKPYSCDENLFHISYESGVLEDPWAEPPEDMFVMTKDFKTAPDETENLIISFKNGIPVKVKHVEENKEYEGDVEMFNFLNDVGMRNGCGRIDIVENRFVGMKSRGVYETPGGTILHKAHMDLESLTMDREVRKIRDTLSLKFAELAYNGFWYTPEMEFLLKAIKESQVNCTGDVKVEVYKGNITMKGRRSPYSLYNEELVSMDIAGQYHPGDAEGFIRINALRMQSYQALKQQIEKKGL